MSTAAKAVFLSYASQDADAARRICDALRAVSVEVWFDQSALLGGDAWDASIRQQTKECALFVPVVSANTQSRSEGYFRRALSELACALRRSLWLVTQSLASLSFGEHIFVTLPKHDARR